MDKQPCQRHTIDQEKVLIRYTIAYVIVKINYFPHHTHPISSMSATGTAAR